MSRMESANPLPDRALSATRSLMKKIATRAATASTKLENRALPPGHFRSKGVKALLEERQARKR